MWHWLVVNGLYHDIVADTVAAIFAVSFAFWKGTPFIRAVIDRLERIERAIEKHKGP